MRGFLILAAGAAALSACAPFEHGHYANDVTYLNSAGDPAGTPLVFNASGGDARHAKTAKHWTHHAEHRHSGTAYAPVTQSYAAPTSYAPVTQSYTAPSSYAPIAQSYTAPVTYSAPVQQSVSYTAPQSYTLAGQPGYQPATQSTYGTATTMGGIRFDSEGYAICDEVYPQGHHRGHAPQGRIAY